MTTNGTSKSTGNPLLSEGAFQTEHSRKLFDALDKLRSCGANEHVDLPELVIVGDQSAGKSSLLQSLTDIPFPVADRLCTRFPTRIVSRRTPDEVETTKMSIEAEGRERHTFGTSRSKVTAADFSAVMDEALKLMLPGLTPDNPESNSSSTPVSHFSREVLKIEISGPNRSHFSIVDVPGVFQTCTGDLTDNERTEVMNMVKSYMRPDESIIVCVASGINDVANQAIFDMTKTYDPKGDRTVGVITKCDISNQHVNQIMHLAQNKEKQLAHGWFVVRNRSPLEVAENIDGEERRRREDEFFAAEPWNRLDEGRRGTGALERYLSNLLCQRIHQHFPVMLDTIRKRLDSTREELKILGSPRETYEHKRAYLTKIANNLQVLVSKALGGHYDSIPSDHMKLRRTIRNSNDEFAVTLRKKGHRFPFLEIPSIKIVEPVLGQKSQPKIFPDTNRSPRAGSFHVTENEQEPLQAYSSPEPWPTSHSPKASFGNGSSGSAFLQTNGGDLFQEFFATPNTKSTLPKAKGGSIFGASTSNTNGNKHPHASRPAPFQQTTVQGSGTVYEMIRKEIQDSRGTALQGTLNPTVLPVLFHRQAHGWREISENHFCGVSKHSLTAVRHILDAVCNDPHAKKGIMHAIYEANDRARSEHLASLSHRLDDILGRHLQTNDPRFEDKIREARLLRFQNALGRYRDATQFGSGALVEIDVRETWKLFNELHMSNSQNVEDEMHDILKAYYELAREKHIDYVTTVVEDYLNDEKGPLKFFSVLYVAGLTDAEIDALATEEGSVVVKRKEKTRALQQLNHALEIASDLYEEGRQSLD